MALWYLRSPRFAQDVPEKHKIYSNRLERSDQLVGAIRLETSSLVPKIFWTKWADLLEIIHLYILIPNNHANISQYTQYKYCKYAVFPSGETIPRLWNEMRGPTRSKIGDGSSHGKVIFPRVRSCWVMALGCEPLQYRSLGALDPQNPTAIRSGASQRARWSHVGFGPSAQVLSIFLVGKSMTKESIE